MPRKYKPVPKKYASPYLEGTRLAAVRIALSIEGDSKRKHLAVPERIVARVCEYDDNAPEYGEVPRFDGYIIDSGNRYEREEAEIMYAERTGRYSEERDFGRVISIVGLRAEVSSAFGAWLERFGETEVWVWDVSSVMAEISALRVIGFYPVILDCRSACAILGIDWKRAVRIEKESQKSKKKHDLRGLNAWAVAAVLNNLTKMFG